MLKVDLDGITSTNNSLILDVSLLKNSSISYS